MEKIIKIDIDDSLNGKKIKEILLENLGISYSALKKIKTTENGITISNSHVRVTREVCKGETLVVKISDKISKNILPKELPLDIIYEDSDIIVLNKPRMMPTHPSHNHNDDTLANALMYYFKGEDFTFRAITRLDRDTSGIVLIAKNPHSAQILSSDMRNKKIIKEYIAVINGTPKEKAGTISAPIKREKEGIILRTVAQDGKESITEYEVLKTKENLSLVRLIPKTGRTHQLRVHLSFIGTPIYGDDLYGAPQKDESTRLHCERLSFTHPVTKKIMTLVAQIPNDIKSLI